ncbi:MAG: hypothetical protein HFG58_16105 [Lachnospiraceae bacterium]|nr:hypothetical protein [Lachnospiraceae bacterium]
MFCPGSNRASTQCQAAYFGEGSGVEVICERPCRTILIPDVMEGVSWRE